MTFTAAFVASNKTRKLLVAEAEETLATVVYEVPILRDNNLSHHKVSEGVQDKTETALAEVMVEEVVLVSKYQVVVATEVSKQHEVTETNQERRDLSNLIYLKRNLERSWTYISNT